MVFSERHSIDGKNGAIKYITHLDKFSYFPKHHNFHEIMFRNINMRCQNVIFPKTKDSAQPRKFLEN